MILAVIVIGALAISMFRRRKSRQQYGFEVAPFGLDAAKLVFYSLLIIAFVYVMNSYKGTPFPIILVILFALIFSFISTKKRHLAAIFMHSAETLRQLVCQVLILKSRTMILFILTGLLSAVAALILTARLTSATITAGQKL
ncbi:hypothetical protein GCM10020331_083460 [Ectobacillus funiculus]